MNRVAAELCAEGIVKTFGLGLAPLSVLDHVSFNAAPNEFVALLGPSGCGKSTLLRLVAALDKPDAGRIAIAGSEPDPRQHRIGFVFQGDSLLPWRTIEQNVALGLEHLDLDATARRRRVGERLALVGLSGFEQYYPHQLSGGMRQRAAVARAFAIEPEVLLMDEPFGSVDVQMRGQLQQQLLSVWNHLKTTVLFVTHDVEEAVVLADRVVLFTPRPARIQEIITVGLPRPRDPLAEDFIALRRKLQSHLHEAELPGEPETMSSGGP